VREKEPLIPLLSPEDLKNGKGSYEIRHDYYKIYDETKNNTLNLVVKSIYELIRLWK